MLAVWSGLARLFLPLVWRYFKTRAENDPDYAAFPEERRGEGPQFRADVWVHAASRVEMVSAEPIVRRLLAEGARVVTTHATPAGAKAAETTFPGAIASGRMAVRFAPIGLPKFWQKFLRRTNPKVALVMEVEFAPAMIEAAARARIPLILTNCELAAGDAARARLMATLVGHPVARAAAVFARSEALAAEFRALGARDVRVMGDTRFDVPRPEAHLSAARAFREALKGRPVVTFWDVGAGEEALYLNAVRTLLKNDTAPFIVWVPGSPDLYDSAATLLREAGVLVTTRRYAMRPDLKLRHAIGGADLLLGNSVGEAFFYLSSADVVVAGGGFAEGTPSSLIEPLAAGRPVIAGPKMSIAAYPVSEAAELGVLKICPRPDALAGEIMRALGGGATGIKEFRRNSLGASVRIVAAIRPLLAGGDP